MWSDIVKNCEKLERNEKWNSSTIIKWVQQSIGEGRRVPKFGADRGPELLVIEKQKLKVQRKSGPAKPGDGNRESQKKEAFSKQEPVIMAARKRIPLIKFPNRRAEDWATDGGGRSQAKPSLPSGTASSQPPRPKLSDAEIDAVLLGAVLVEPAPKKAAPDIKI